MNVHTRTLQLRVGAKPDGIMGPDTLARTLAKLVPEDGQGELPTHDLFHLGTTSERNLIGVVPKLVLVVRRTIQITTIDFKVNDGLRTLDEQKAYLEAGTTWTLNSRHLTGHAVDLVAIVDGQVSWLWPHYDAIGLAVKQAARELNVDITSGIDWPPGRRDGAHHQITWGT